MHLSPPSLTLFLSLIYMPFPFIFFFHFDPFEFPLLHPLSTSETLLLLTSNSTQFLSSVETPRCLTTTENILSSLSLCGWLSCLITHFLQQATENGVSYFATNFHVSVHPCSRQRQLQYKDLTYRESYLCKWNHTFKDCYDSHTDKQQ
jgi:hypothetical protein